VDAPTRADAVADETRTRKGYSMTSSDAAVGLDGPVNVEPPTAYDPFSYQVQEDPYPIYAWMREHAPVYRNEARDFYALSRHADVLAALRDPVRFTNRNGISLESSARTAVRGLVQKNFSLRNVGVKQGRIREMRIGIHQPVPVRRTATQIPALITSLSPHRRGRAVPRAQHLPPRAGPNCIASTRCTGSVKSIGPSTSGNQSWTPCWVKIGAIASSWPPQNARSHSPITIASNPRSGSVTASSSRAACGRLAHGNRRVHPTSKNSPTISPRPAINSFALSRCQDRDEAGS
jgi:hypothetical protein